MVSTNTGPPKLCVLGLGYVGLPTATMFAKHGCTVVGVDTNERIRAVVATGRSHIDEPGLEILVSESIFSGRLRVASTPEHADAFVIAVPTPVNPVTKEANCSYVVEAVNSVLPFLEPGNIVIIESTVPPGTTRHLIGPLLASSGLEPGRNVLLAHCPERVLPGRVLVEIVQNDRLVGGLTHACSERAAELYGCFVKGAILKTDATTAELTKTMENTYRDVNVALANEFALIAEQLEVNVWEAIELANRHPRVQILRPGPGVGGHCVAVDPWFLVRAAPARARLIRTAREVNDCMPEEVLARIEALVSPPGPVALLGITYKADVADTRESPGLRVAELALERGYRVRLHDPYVSPEADSLPGPVLSLDDAVRGAQVIVLLVDHTSFRDIDIDLVSRLVCGRRVLDTRAALDPTAWQARGFQVAILGHGALKKPVAATIG
jgi:UDP-N-acetyl-D-mannosaminuronic acid dehydrogenase